MQRMWQDGLTCMHKRSRYEEQGGGGTTASVLAGREARHGSIRAAAAAGRQQQWRRQGGSSSSRGHGGGSNCGRTAAAAATVSGRGRHNVSVKGEGAHTFTWLGQGDSMHGGQSWPAGRYPVRTTVQGRQWPPGKAGGTGCAAHQGACENEVRDSLNGLVAKG